jgi:hypothetical protein
VLLVCVRQDPFLVPRIPPSGSGGATAAETRLARGGRDAVYNFANSVTGGGKVHELFRAAPSTRDFLGLERVPNIPLS